MSRRRTKRPLPQPSRKDDDTHEFDKRLFGAIAKSNINGILAEIYSHPSPWKSIGEKGNTILHVACLTNKPEVVAIVLTVLPSVDSINNDGKAAVDLTNSGVIKKMLRAHSGRCLESSRRGRKGGSKWDDIRDHRDSLIQEISVKELGNIVNKIRKEYAEIAVTRGKIEENYFDEVNFKGEQSRMIELIHRTNKAGDLLSQRISSAAGKYKKYKEMCSSISEELKVNLVEVRAFLQRLESEYDSQKENLVDSQKFTSYVVYLNQERIEQLARGSLIADQFIKTNKRILEEQRKYQKQKLQFQMQELMGKKRGEKLRKSEVKVNQRENDLMERKRGVEELKKELFSPHLKLCYGERKSVSEKHLLQSEFLQKVKTFLGRHKVTNDLWNSFHSHGVVFDRTLDDYEDLQRFQVHEHSFMLGYLKKGDPVQKLLKYFTVDDLKDEENLDEVLALMEMKKDDVSKSFCNISACFHYQSQETKEVKLVIENDFQPNNLYQWCKGEYQVNDIDVLLGKKNKRGKFELKMVFKDIVRAACYAVRKGFFNFKPNPMSIRVGYGGSITIYDYSIKSEDPFVTKLFSKKSGRKKSRKQKGRYEGEPFYLVGMMLFELLCSSVDDAQYFPNFPNYFSKNESEFLDLLLSGECDENLLLAHPFWTEEEKSSKRIKSIEDIQENRVESDVEYLINIKKSSNIVVPLLSMLLDMRDLDDLCGLFKTGKFGVDGFGNLSPFVLELFFKQCAKQDYFDGRNGAFLPTDEKILVNEFTAIGRLMLKLLLEKRSELPPIFTPFAVSYIVGEEIVNEKRWEIYCRLFDRRYVESMKNLLKEPNIDRLGLIFDSGRAVTSGNVTEYLSQKFKKRLCGSKHRMENLACLRNGFQFAAKSDLWKVKVSDLITFFSKKKKR